MSDFFAMGGYAWYVWMAYGVTALVIVWEIVAVRVARPSTRARYGPAGSA